MLPRLPTANQGYEYPEYDSDRARGFDLTGMIVVTLGVEVAVLLRLIRGRLPKSGTVVVG